MPNKIVIVTGDRGSGKTTLAVNLAARLATLRKLPVIMVDTDLLAHGDLAQTAGTHAGGTVSQLVEQLANKQITLPMLRGRVALSKANLGLLNLGTSTKDAEKLTPAQWRFFLSSFSQLYDLVVDMDPLHPLQASSIDMADALVWSMLPTRQSIRRSTQALEALYAQKYSFHHFLFAMNQIDEEGSLAEEDVDAALGKFHEAIDVSLPKDSDLVRLLNTGKPVFPASPRTAYAQAIQQLTDLILPLTRAANPGMGVPYVNGTTPGVTGAGAALQVEVASRMQKEKNTLWNQTKQQLHRDLVEELNLRRIDLDTKGDPVRERQLRTSVENTVNALIGKEQTLTLTREEREQLVKELVDEALGLGPLEELLRDPSITEIMVNRADQVYIERRGKIVLSDKRFIDNNHVVQVIRRIIAPLGRRIDESVPLVDARLKDGSRVNAIIPPLAVNGPSITIRRFPERAFSSDDLVRIGSINPEMVEFLKVCILSKKNVVIAGGTGTGKTTILNMLSAFIPNDERIVTVEDTAELRLAQDHVVRLEARPPNMEGQGQVSIRDLVKNCLRMRPDRIVVGECRAGEALDMLQAMNTGHDGSLTTIHANSPRDAFTRLETLCLMAGMDLPVWALREQIKSAVHLVVQLSRLQDGSRRITSITEVIGRDEQTILSQDIFRFVQEGVDAKGQVHGHFESTGSVPTFLKDLLAKGLKLDESVFKKRTL